MLPCKFVGAQNSILTSTRPYQWYMYQFRDWKIQTTNQRTTTSQKKTHFLDQKFHSIHKKGAQQDIPLDGIIIFNALIFLLKKVAHHN